MSKEGIPSELRFNGSDIERGSTTLHICTSCRPEGHPKEPHANRPGFMLYQELSARIFRSSLQSKVCVKGTRCLSLCPRPCGISFSSPGAWTYLFGDQKHGETTTYIIKCLEIFINEPDGHLPRGSRPKALQSSILGRVPPEGS